MLNSRIKITTAAFTILVLIITMMGFGCHVSSVSTTTTVSTNTTTGQTTVSTGVTVVIVPEEFRAESNAMSNSAYIVDLSKEWSVDQSVTPQATIRVEGANGQFTQQSFALSAAAENIISVDKQTRALPFVFNNPSDVQAFMNNALAQANSSFSAQAAITLDVNFGITQNNCTLPSGKYVNHIRYQDETGITYISSPTIHYIAPESFWGGDGQCNIGQIIVED